MTKRAQTLAPAYFDGLYGQNVDPWNFASSDYERDKYAHTLEALPEPSYANALEIGCSIGILTRSLAARCEKLLAIDVADAALDQARRRCEGLAHVAFARLFVPGEWPVGNFDLILLSEVVYYLDAGDVGALAERVARSTKPGATIALVHWLGETDYPLTGDEAANLFVGALQGGVEVVLADRRREYRLDILRRR